jgi:NADH-quinone oxidoreductase subunit M
VTNEKNRALPDMSGREWAMMIPTIALCIFMGVFPNFFLRPMEPSVRKVIDKVNGVSSVARRDAPRVPRVAPGGAR